MRNHRTVILIYSFFLFLPLMSGQTMVSGDHFPQIGDTMLMATDHLPIQIDIGTKGSGKFWDFSSLQSAFAKRIQVLPFSNYTEYEALDQASARLDFDGEERYLSFQEQAVMEHGRRIPNPFIPGDFLVAIFEKPVAAYRILRYLDRKAWASRAHATLDLDQLVSTNQFAGIENVKEARLVIDIDTKENVDAWGQIKIPHASFSVLRQRVQEIWTSQLEIRDGLGNWKIVNPNQFGMDAPIPVRKEYYRFLSDEESGPIAIVNVTPKTQNIESVDYKSFSYSNRVIPNLAGRSDVFVYPNPTFDVVRFDLVNLPEDTYKIQIFNILGVPIKNYDVEVDGYTTIQIDLSELKKGTYIYRLTDSRQNSIKSKRLVIIQP